MGDCAKEELKLMRESNRTVVAISFIEHTKGGNR